MDWAKRVSQLSHAKRLQVGSVIVKDDCVISYGYNGMPASWDNECEDIIQHSDDTISLKTQNLQNLLIVGWIVQCLLLIALVWSVPNLYIKAALILYIMIQITEAMTALSFSKNQE